MTFVKKHEDIFKKIREILDHDPDEDGVFLSNWELDFMDNVKGLSLFSPKQDAVIHRIWNKLFVGTWDYEEVRDDVTPF